jgi:hypothetical protein
MDRLGRAVIALVAGLALVAASAAVQGGGSAQQPQPSCLVHVDANNSVPGRAATVFDAADVTITGPDAYGACAWLVAIGSQFNGNPPHYTGVTGAYRLAAFAAVAPVCTLPLAGDTVAIYGPGQLAAGLCADTFTNILEQQ